MKTQTTKEIIRINTGKISILSGIAIFFSILLLNSNYIVISKDKIMFIILLMGLSNILNGILLLTGHRIK